MAKEGGTNATVNRILADENQSEGGVAGNIITSNNLQTGDKLLYEPVPDNKDNPDETPAVGVNQDKKPNANNGTQAPVINISPEAVKTGAKIAVAAIVIWKAIELVSTLPFCGGCGVLSPL